MKSRNEHGTPRSPRFEAGLAHLDRGRTGLARRAFLRSHQEAEPRAVWALQQFALVELGRGRAAEIEEFFRLVLPSGSALLEHLLGFSKRRTGRLGEAREHLERAVELDPRLWPAVNELGYLRCRQGERSGGDPLLRRAERQFQRAGDDWGRASSLALRATLALHRFELEPARVLFRRAIQLKRRCGDRLTMAHALCNLGHVNLYLGDYRSAIRAYRENIDLMQGRRDDVALGQAFQGLANAHADLAEWPEAVRAIGAAVRHFRRGGRKDLLSLALVSLGAVHRDAGDRRLALRHARAALAVGAASEDPDLRGQILVFLAEILTKVGRAATAARLLAEWLRQRPAAGRARTEIVLAREQARAAAGQRDWPAAAAFARRCLALARKLPDSGQALVQEWISAETVLGRALLESGRRGPAVRVLRRAEAELERLLERQQGAPIRIGLLETYSSVHAALIDSYLLDDSPRAGLSAWAVASQLKARELGRHASSLPGEGPGSRPRAAWRRRGTIPTGNEIRRLLGPREALIEYDVSPERTKAFLVLDGSVAAFDVGCSGTRIGLLVERLVAPLHAAGSAADAAVHLGAYDERLAARLARKLLAPLRSRLGGLRRLIVVPHGPLHTLPFESLPLEAAAGSPVYLGDVCEVAYAPSSSLLRAPSRPRRGGAVLAFSFSPDRPILLPGAEGRWIGPLPAATREARMVASRFPGSRRVVGPAATIAAYRDLAPRSQLIHISAHTVPDPEAPMLQSLVLAPARQGSGFSLLRAREIPRTRLRAGLVALSACSTQVGRLRANEGTLGLARAFLEAGAEAVLASRWPIEDAAAERLARGFYRRVGEGEGFASALAQARRALRKTHPHPFYWAPFLLIERSIRPA